MDADELIETGGDYEEEQEWDEETCEEAASNGHPEVLKWACENGCPWDNKWRTRPYR